MIFRIYFQNNDFCLSKLLKTYPLKTKQSQLSPQDTRHLHKLIQDNHKLGDICAQINRPQPEVIDEIVILIRTGFPVTKVHLANLVGATDEILRFLKSSLTDEDFLNLDNIAEVKAKFATNTHITEELLVLVLNYFKVRQFLNSINVSYFDVDENQLVNGKVLLGSKTIKAVESQSNEGKANQSQVSDLLQEDEDDFAAAIANLDSVSGLAIVNPSQTTNQYQNIKKFEAEEPTKMSQTQNKGPAKMPTLQNKEPAKVLATQNKEPVKMPLIQTKTTTANNKRPAAKRYASTSSKYSVRYMSESDSDSADEQAPQNKRAVPQWLTTKPSTTTTNNNTKSNSIRKNTF